MKHAALAVLFLLLLTVAFSFPDVHGTQWGRITLALGGWQVETSLPPFLILLLAFLVALRLLAALWRLPRHWAHWRQRQRQHKKEKTLLAGLSLFAQGEWQRAHECFAGADKPMHQAGSARLLSVLALLNKQSFTKARQALRALSESEVPDAERVAEIKCAEIELRLGHYAQAFAELQRLFILYPHNRHLAGLLVQAFVNQSRPMPSTPRDQLLALVGNEEPVVVSLAAERRLLSEKLHELLERGDKKALSRVWQKIRKPMQKRLAGVYAECLGQLGLYEQAERFMRQAIEAGWGGRCLNYYALMDGGDVRRRAAQIEKRLQDKPHDPALLLCLGRLYRRYGEQEKARRCLSLCLKLAPQSAAGKELNELLAGKHAA